MANPWKHQEHLLRQKKLGFAHFSSQSSVTPTWYLIWRDSNVSFSTIISDFFVRIYSRKAKGALFHLNVLGNQLLTLLLLSGRLFVCDSAELKEFQFRISYVNSNVRMKQIGCGNFRNPCLESYLIFILSACTTKVWNPRALDKHMLEFCKPTMWKLSTRISWEWTNFTLRSRKLFIRTDLMWSPSKWQVSNSDNTLLFLVEDENNVDTDAHY